MARSRSTRGRRPDHQRTAVPKGVTGLWWRALVIALAGLAVYSNSLSGPFVFDDQLSIVENASIREWWRLGSVLFPERELPTAGRPLVNLSFALNYAAGGLDVRGYHLGNLALHIGCALLMFGVVRRTLELPAAGVPSTTTAANLAFGAALVWVIHPLNSEAVDYLSQRTELFMALFYVLTLYAAIRAWRSTRPRAWQALAVLACGAGMACKESMVTAPVVVLLYDRIFLYKSAGDALRHRWRFYAGLAATWLLLAALMSSGPRIHSAGFSSGVSPWTYLLNQTIMIARYVWLAVWPSSLVLNYGVPLPLTLGEVLPYALIVVVLLVLTAIALGRRPALGFLGAWVFITLAPTSSFVPIATEVGAERRMYLPLMALAVLAVIAVSRGIVLLATARSSRAERLTSSIFRWASASLLILASTALAAATISRNREYESSLSLARTVAERYPTSVAHHMLGAELSRTGRGDQALTELRLALPGDPKASYTLGVELFRQDKLNEAIAAFERFVREQPMLLEVISARDLMGQAFARQRQWSQAARQYRTLLSMRPASVEYQGHLAESLFQDQAFQEAVVEYTKYLQLRPRDVPALTNLGIALAALDRGDEAITAFRRVVEIDARSGDAQKNLANALFDRRDTDGALEHARRAVALMPDDPGARDVLGRTLAVKGQLAAARAEFERALRIDPNHAEARTNLDRLREHAGRLGLPPRR
jgi:tetratricopeptide (TPR) repeat protein